MFVVVWRRQQSDVAEERNLFTCQLCGTNDKVGFIHIIMDDCNSDGDNDVDDEWLMDPLECTCAIVKNLFNPSYSVDLQNNYCGL